MKPPLKRLLTQHINQLLRPAVARLCQQEVLAAAALQEAAQGFHLARPRGDRHGDFASNAALTLIKHARGGINPRQLATRLVAEFARLDVADKSAAAQWLEKSEVAGPGFINFFIADHAYRALIDPIRRAGATYGRSDIGAGQRVLLEFVSANPTGPLHVGHGRGAAYGDATARVLRAAGYQVHCEYYVNDAGRQVDILALSVWLRYLEVCAPAAKSTADSPPTCAAESAESAESHPNSPATSAESADFPAGAYHGAYIRDLAAGLHAAHGHAFAADPAAVFADLPAEPEARLDALIARCKTMLGKRAYAIVHAHGCDSQVADIRDDLRQFGVCFEGWFSERSLLENGDIERALAALQDAGHSYQKDGAVWFRATDFGDEKDRAVRRSNGAHTYFAADIAYHFNKGERGFDQLVNIFGADHHGYAKRITASFEALGHRAETLRVLLVQFATLYRGGVKAQMSTRSGDFVTLRELRQEVGNDAARFFYAARKNDQHMDFDLDLAKTQSADNPVYYIQYAHARICSVFRQLQDKNLPTLPSLGESAPAASAASAESPDYGLLSEPHELDLMRNLARYPEVVEQAAGAYEPHQVAYYLRELAGDFHVYYNAHPFLSSAAAVRLARLGLIDAVRQVLAGGLELLGVSAPARM